LQPVTFWDDGYPGTLRPSLVIGQPSGCGESETERGLAVTKWPASDRWRVASDKQNNLRAPRRSWSM